LKFQAEYVKFIKDIPSEEGRQAEIAMYRRQPDEAERILLQASPPLIYRAIKLNLRIFRWGRALELAVKHKSHLDTVLAYRQKHLMEFDTQETNPRFVQLAGQVSLTKGEKISFLK
jgi:intraflagellar transport protein 80